MAAGLPVIAVAAGGLLDIMTQPGKTGASWPWLMSAISPPPLLLLLLHLLDGQTLVLRAATAACMQCKITPSGKAAGYASQGLTRCQQTMRLQS